MQQTRSRGCLWAMIFFIKWPLSQVCYTMTWVSNTETCCIKTWQPIIHHRQANPQRIHDRCTDNCSIASVHVVDRSLHNCSQFNQAGIKIGLSSCGLVIKFLKDACQGVGCPAVYRRKCLDINIRKNDLQIMYNKMNSLQVSTKQHDPSTMKIRLNVATFHPMV